MVDYYHLQHNVLNTSQNAYLAYYLQEINATYSSLRQLLEEVSYSQVTSSYSLQIHQLQTSLTFYVDSTSVQQRLSFLQGLYKILFSLFELCAESNLLSSSLLVESHTQMLFGNLKHIQSNLDALGGAHQSKLHALTGELQGLNITIFVLAVLVLLLSFLITIPPLAEYRRRLEGILKITARFTEREAQQQIAGLQIASTFVKSSGEQYMNLNIRNKQSFTNLSQKGFQLLEESERMNLQLIIMRIDRFCKQNTQSNAATNQSQLLQERILEQKTRIYFFVVFLLLLFFLGMVLFILIFANNVQLKNFIEPAAETYQRFVDSYF